jgi:hypothetical protein
MTPTLAEARERLRHRPICDARHGGRWCKRIAVSAAYVGTDGAGRPKLESRCPGHADPDAPRLCTTCKAAHRSGDDWLCGSCLVGDELDASAWVLP